MKDLIAFIVCILCGVAVAVPAAFFPAPDHPPLGWTTTGTVTNVVDGDTVDIEIRRTIRVRMLECWAPEQHVDPRIQKERQAAEKKAGLESKANLKALALGKPVTLHVPTDGSGDVAKLTTMGRVLGTIWIEGSDKSLNQLQVEGGFATRQKREELK